MSSDVSTPADEAASLEDASDALAAGRQGSSDAVEGVHGERSSQHIDDVERPSEQDGDDAESSTTAAEEDESDSKQEGEADAESRAAKEMPLSEGKEAINVWKAGDVVWLVFSPDCWIGG